MVIVVIGLFLVAARSEHRSSGHVFADRVTTGATACCTGGDIQRASQEDLSEYLAFLDDTNLSEAQKFELLQTLWSIMSAFVDLAFGTDPVQQALPSIAATQRTDNSIVSAVTPAEQK